MASTKIGDLEIWAINDGVLHASYDPFQNIERSEAVRLVGRPDTGPGSLPISVNAFLIKRNGKYILSDAGSGTTLGPTLGHLPANLRAAGVAPEAIDTVLMTHIHPDHANGLIDDDGKPHFPNATVIVHDVEAAFWLDQDSVPGEIEMRQRNRRNGQRAFAPYRERTKRVKDGEAAPGISAHLQPGHTPGHASWLMQSGKEPVLMWGDIVHNAAIQMAHPEATLTFDLDPGAAHASRKRMLEWAVADKLIVAGAHLEPPGIGRVVRRGTGYAFEPI